MSGTDAATHQPSAPRVQEWIDRLEIRDLIERSVRCIDDQAGARLAQMFDEQGVLQVAGTVFCGRAAIQAMFSSADPRAWWEPGELLKQPKSAHCTSNPVVDLMGDSARAETDMFVLQRDDSGRARITLVARYRDRLRRQPDGRWLIVNRTGVSIARPGQEGTDEEWAKALARMPDDVRAAFRTDY